MVSAINPKIEAQAKKLASSNRESEPEIIDVYWFPADDEIRLVETEADTVKTLSGQVEPFYFSPSPTDGLDYVLAIAIIKPDEFGTLDLPPKWGTWADAIQLKGV